MALHHPPGPSLGAAQAQPWKVTRAVPVSFRRTNMPNGTVILSAILPDGTVDEWITDKLTIASLTRRSHTPQSAEQE